MKELILKFSNLLPITRGQATNKYPASFTSMEISIGNFTKQLTS